MAIKLEGRNVSDKKETNRGGNRFFEELIIEATLSEVAGAKERRTEVLWGINIQVREDWDEGLNGISLVNEEVKWVNCLGIYD